MRIAFFTHYSGMMGANRSLIDLIDGLRSYGVESWVFCATEGLLTEELSRRNIPWIVSEFRKWMENPREWRHVFHRARRNWKYAKSLSGTCRDLNIDVIYTNSSVTPIGAMVSFMTGLPHVWHFREFGFLDYGLKYDWGWLGFKAGILWADAYVAVSQAVRREVLGNVPSRKIHVIYNGIAHERDFDRWNMETVANRMSPGKFTFALVGLVHPNKGQDVAIRAFSVVKQNHPNVHLVIAGPMDSGYARGCVQLVLALGLSDSVEFPGYVRSAVPVFQRADVALMCSKYEAMGRVTAEAMAACCPVIGVASGGTPELIEHEYTGLLYDGGQEALAAHMCRMVENRKWTQELGRNAWRDARQKYTIEGYARRVNDVLQSLGRR